MPTYRVTEQIVHLQSDENTKCHNQMHKYVHESVLIKCCHLLRIMLIIRNIVYQVR